MREILLLEKYILHPMWCYKQRKRLRNFNPTIISNNCTAGFIYHDLGLKFLSPTINLTVKDFPLFISHLEHYLSCELIEISRGGGTPKGRLVSDHFPSIEIVFNHYSSFQEAKEKWEMRKKRVNFSNLFIIMECYDNYFPNEFLEYCELPYNKDRVILTHSKHEDRKDSIFISCTNDINRPFVGGETFKIRRFSGKRFLDDFDYVSFLNGKVAHSES